MKRKTNTGNLKEDRNHLTLIGHLSELRQRIIYSAIFFIVTAGLCYHFSEFLVKDIIKRAPDMNFVFIAPAELMLSYIKLALLGGLVISAPFLLIQIWLFVSPGLESRERRYLSFFLIIGSFFFIVGGLFAYYLVLPYILIFFAGFQIEEIKAMISFSSYLSFVVNILLAFGAVFELPIVILLLTRFGFIDVKFLTDNRKYIVLIIFVVAAILTPPDVISQVMLALPMLALFEIGVVLARMGSKKQ